MLAAAFDADRSLLLLVLLLFVLLPKGLLLKVFSVMEKPALPVLYCCEMSDSARWLARRR